MTVFSDEPEPEITITVMEAKHDGSTIEAVYVETPSPNFDYGPESTIPYQGKMYYLNHMIFGGGEKDVLSVPP